MDIHGLLMLYPHILLLKNFRGYSEVKVQISTVYPGSVHKLFITQKFVWR